MVNEEYNGLGSGSIAAAKQQRDSEVSKAERELAKAEKAAREARRKVDELRAQ